MTSGEIERALVIVHLGHTRIGDSVQAITNLRCLAKHLRIQRLDVNLIDPAEHRIGAELLKHDPLMGRYLNLPYEDVPYQDYQVVLHYSVFKDCEIVRVLADRQRVAAAGAGAPVFYSLPASRWDLEHRYGDSWHDFAYPLPLLDLPLDFFQRAIGDHQVYLGAEERAWATRWLAQAGVTADDVLIVFVDESSTREKALHPRCSLRVLEHLLSIDRVKALVYDVDDRGKKAFYRLMLKQELFGKIVFSTRNDLRRNIALLAAPNVRLIFGPDTGIMHCAVGVHSTHPTDDRVAGAERPPIVVYAGRWQNFNSWNLWGQSSACCVLPYDTPSGTVLKPLAECPRDDEGFLKDLKPVSAVPPGLMIDFLESRFGPALRASALLPRA